MELCVFWHVILDESLSDQSTIETLASMLHHLPKEHFHLIHYIIILASNIQQHASVNMMNPEALAIVLAPVCTGLEHNLKEIPSWVKRHSRAKMMTDMSHFIETNAKWTRLWTLMIEHSDKLLEIWKHVPLWEVRTVPCHPSAFHSSSAASSHQQGRHSTTLSPLEQTELLLDIAPQRRPSYHSQRSDELYKVVVMRSRQNTCKSLKKNSSSTTSRRSQPTIMDDSSMKVPTTPKRHSMVHTSSWAKNREREREHLPFNLLISNTLYTIPPNNPHPHVYIIILIHVVLNTEKNFAIDP